MLPPPRDVNDDTTKGARNERKRRRTKDARYDTPLKNHVCVPEMPQKSIFVYQKSHKMPKFAPFDDRFVVRPKPRVLRVTIVKIVIVRKSTNLARPPPPRVLPASPKPPLP